MNSESGRGKRKQEVNKVRTPLNIDVFAWMVCCSLRKALYHEKDREQCDLADGETKRDFLLKS
jgi:hypothetical protein